MGHHPAHRSLQLALLLAVLAPGLLLAQDRSTLQDTVAYATTTLRLRAQPDTAADILAILASGTRVRTDKCAEEWCHVTVPANRRTGYLAASYLTLTAPVAGEPQGRGYINSRGVWVPSPQRTPRNEAPAGATARCRDGTYSFSQSRRGTCSHHGGVAKWLTP